MMVLDIQNLKNARITLTLIFVNILCFFIFNLVLSQESILLFVQINRNIIDNYELWRLITPIFMHGDPIHLFSNMIALLLFGATVENNNNISKIQYLTIYFMSGLIGNVFSLILLPLDSISLGASGAIFGLIGVAFLIIATDYPPLLFFALFYIAFFIITSFTPGINYWAHIFGLMGGLLFGYLFYIRKRKIRITY
ncbi:MAG: rhomboid family intramembrane serine protease [Promethearchaeota archaeon]|nr:MAG: rhomboid family intramembrane serine protease [Candidatus Lokiarchaeota archaeon]